MKKTIALLLALLLALSALLATAEPEQELILGDAGIEIPEDESEGGIELEDEAVAQEALMPDELELDLPEISDLLSNDLTLSVDGLEVAADSAAFAANDSADFEIEDGVLVKYKGAGGDVVIPGGVTSIGKYAFFDCQSLTKVIIPTGVTSIGDCAFQCCPNLATVSIPNTVVELRPGAFSRTGLTSVTVPGSVKSIGGMAFRDCNELAEVTLEDGVTLIEYWAFKDCPKLQTVTIPASVTEMGRDPFEGCPATMIIRGTRNSGAQRYADEYDYNFWPLGEAMPEFEEIGVTDGFTYRVHSDGTATISKCSLTGEVAIPASIDGHKVVSLRSELFFSNDSITGVTVPATVSYFGTDPSDNDWDFVFSYCRDLQYINVESGNPTFCSVDGVLYSKDKSRLINYPCARAGSSYVVPDSVTRLCCTSFAAVENLQTLYLGSKEAIWMGYTFAYDGGLTVYYLKGGRTEYKAESAISAGSSHDADPDFWPTYTGYEGDAFYLDGQGEMHALVTDAAVAATCTEAGKTEGRHCSICNKVFKAQQQIPATGHTVVTDPAVKAICTEAGKTKGSHCSICGKVIEAQKTIPATGHTPVIDPAVPATYTQTGLTEGSHCAVCGEVLVKQQVVPKLTPTATPKPVVSASPTARVTATPTAKPTAEVTATPTAKPTAKVTATPTAKPTASPTADPTRVTLNKTKATLVAGAKLTLKAKLTPAKAKTTLTWSSSNKKVATVTQKGEVKAIGEGTAVITVKTVGGKKATCKITVPKAPTKVTLSKTKAMLVVGAKLTLKAKLAPVKAKTTLTWSSSNKKVAMVSKNGVVKALKAGTATITVRTANGKKATCKVTVPAAPTKVAFAKKSYSVKAGKKITLKTKLTPAKAKTTLTWSSSNKKIATVTQKGVVKGIRKGTVTITVKTANGKKATVKVTVK